MGESQHLPPPELPGTSVSFLWGTTFHQQPKNLGGHPGTLQQHGLSPCSYRRHFGGSELWHIPGLGEFQSSPGIPHRGGSWNTVCLHLQQTQLALCPCTAVQGLQSHPLPKDKHLGILPQGKAEESSYGQIRQLEVCQLLSTSPQVVYPVGLNGDNEPVTTTLPEPLRSGASVTTNEHPYMRIDIPHLPQRNQNGQLCQLIRLTPFQQPIHPKPLQSQESAWQQRSMTSLPR